MIPFHQAGALCIEAQHQPSLVLDYARSRELPARTVLAGTGLDEMRCGEPDRAMAPTEYLRLLANVAGALDSADTSFQLGQNMLPGHFGAVSHALMQAPSLREAIALLLRYQIRLSPLLVPHFADTGHLAAIYWTDAFGASRQRGFLVEMHMAALGAMCRWLSGERLPWHFCFNRTQPRHSEQFEMHLGPQLRFACQLDAMLIDASYLDKSWTRGNPTAAAIAASKEHPDDITASLLGVLYTYLSERVRAMPALEQTATAFGVSPATFKRQLARHGTHFQAEVDQVRAHESLKMIHRGYDNEALARHLGFHDANNFRRSFKRWTGLTPMLLRAGLRI